MVSMLNSKGKEKILKAGEKGQILYRGTTIRITANYLSVSQKAIGFKVLKGEKIAKPSFYIQ